MTVDCRGFFMPTCTGSMWQIGFGTSSPSQSTGVYTIKRRGTWRTAVSLSPTALGTSSPAGRATSSTQYTRPSCIFCRRTNPIVWNSLPDELRDDMEDSCFRQSLKTLFFSQYLCAQRIRGVLVHDNALYKSTFYLLTYFPSRIHSLFAPRSKSPNRTLELSLSGPFAS